MLADVAIVVLIVVGVLVLIGADGADAKARTKDAGRKRDG